MSHFDNHMAWGLLPGHYEVWYITLTHLPSRTGFWIRYTLEAPQQEGERAYAQLWFSRGTKDDPQRTFGINRRFPIEQLVARRDPFGMQIGAARLWEEGLCGAVSGNGHEARWDLRFTPSPRTHRHLPRFAYARGGRLVDTVVFSPNLSIALHGTIVVDGQIYELSGDPGGQTHLWGRKHAYSWAWGHCNAFTEGEGHRACVVEALSVQLRRGPVLTPHMNMLSVYPDGLSGEELAFKQVWQLPFVRSSYGIGPGGGSYRILARGLTAHAEVAFTCAPEDLVRAEYSDPDSEAAYCHNTVVARCDLRLSRRAFPGARLRLCQKVSTDFGGHFEWGARAGDPQVRNHHVAVDRLDGDTAPPQGTRP